MRLMTASSRSSRNSRGRGLPVCGFGVTVPISTKPKPSRSSASGTSAFLSKPAAMPTGLGKFRPKARTASFGSSGSRPDRRQQPQALDRHAVRVLRIEPAQQRQRKGVEGADHGVKLRDVVKAVRTARAARGRR